MYPHGRDRHDQHYDVTADIPVATMRGLCAKDYEVGCTIEQDDVTTQFFVGTIAIVDRIVT
jgi:hypothetical protein